ncbi:helix-turn-helix transcriptional regulator [Corynebacterium sp. NPDC060344]|uniref:helix-turn-helix transcriptional regulator n=1 Tax=Corynebacterium sp. NPDC060344 TaxID=3347101 RepID=UPI00365AD9C4
MTTVLDTPGADFHTASLLTTREAQVLDAWLNAPSKAEAAKSLMLTENTVRTHIRRIRAKYTNLGYDVSTKNQLLERVIVDGLL